MSALKWKPYAAKFRDALMGQRGPRYSAQRLAWLMIGSGGWRLRAIEREEFPGVKVSAAWLWKTAVKGGKVRHVLRTYYPPSQDLEHL